MDINKLPKFIINLEKRPEKLQRIKKEMEYLGWDYEVFKAVDMDSHIGCSMSHLEIINIAKKRNYENVLVIEDDCTFMPYAKSLIEKIKETTEGIEFGVFNLSPTLNRPIFHSEKYEYLNDLTKYPAKEPQHRDIFATNMIIYNESIYDTLFLISGSTYYRPYYRAIDEFIFTEIMEKKQSYCPILPLAPQKGGWSDVSAGEYNTFYTQTYNWNSYSKFKIPGEFMDSEKNEKLKLNNIHKEFYYES